MQHAFRSEIDYYAERAAGLLASARDGNPAAVGAFDRYGAELSDVDARTVVAREHGFTVWDELAAHVANLDDEPFARAYRTIEAHDLDGLAALLTEFPALVGQTGTNGNDLLGLAAGTCDERLCRVLLDHGADPARGNVHGWTPLHQAAYSGLPWLARMLLEAGAPLDVSGRGAGGTPLVVALFWGNRELAELLAGHSLAPGNLRVAAGLGRVDLLDSPGAPRAFYRPHSGFPFWRPSDDPAEVRDEALSWAARNGRVDTVRALADRGADLDADVYRGTALTWAASCGQESTVRALLELGADVNRRGTFGGPGHGQGITALHLAAQNNRLDVITALLEAGADPSIEDELFSSTPLGWATHFDRHEAKALLASATVSRREA
ncbi:ankyrin repeat domain-containing protein [Amycolatopsis sp. GM8]|uniref:ankyrin repeat domain-containing protein n=1 Tax=Amycolatopsis sp. GM8 TaxID=2896530 RepID=UPI001F2D5814|nr:ankyrin repeat domain-containing protein [Amycolatopsis sp. GM8]